MTIPSVLFADASYYIALLNRADADRDRAIAWQRFVVQHRIATVTSEAVLWEMLSFFAGAGREQAFGAYKRLHLDASVRVIGFEDALCRASVELYGIRPDQAWGMIDCLSFATMQKLKITAALSLDHHFEQAGFVALLRQRRRFEIGHDRTASRQEIAGFEVYTRIAKDLTSSPSAAPSPRNPSATPPG